MQSFSKTLAALTLTFAGMTCFAASYPMICRGGGSFKVNTFAQIVPTGSGTSVQPTIDLFFEKATTASGSNGENLKPGQCAWLDRAINASEPSGMSDQSALGNPIYLSAQQTSGSPAVLGISSRYSPLAATGGELHFFKIYVSNDGTVFRRDNTQAVTFFDQH